MYVFYGFCKFKFCLVYSHLKSDVFCKITETRVMCLFKIHKTFVFFSVTVLLLNCT